MKGSCAKPTEEACRVSPKAIAVAGLSAIAIAAGGCTGGDGVDTSSEAYKQGYELVHSHGIPGDLASGGSTVDEARRVCKSLYTAWAGTPELRTAETKRDYDAGCDDGLASLGDPPAVDVTKLRAEFKERFGTPDNEAPWYRHITAISWANGQLEVKTDFTPEEYQASGATPTPCVEIFNLASEQLEEPDETALIVAVFGPGGVRMGSCG